MCVMGSREHLLSEGESSPYFTFDSSKCIVCSRCVRACEETQGTFALTISGRGFDSRVSVGPETNFLESTVSVRCLCRRLSYGCVDRKQHHRERNTWHSVTTTCAYCGVGCGFKAEMRGQEVIHDTVERW